MAIADKQHNFERIVKTMNNDMVLMVDGMFNRRVDNGTEAMAAVLELAMEHLKFMSTDAIKMWISETLDFGSEILAIHKDTNLKKRIIVYRKMLDFYKEREKLIEFFINTYLSFNGLNTLQGFGMANVASDKGRSKTKSKIKINPERRSIY